MITTVQWREDGKRIDSADERGSSIRQWQEVQYGDLFLQINHALQCRTTHKPGYIGEST
jgi:hypothetical protein